MHNELTNLLPQERRDQLVRDYRIRLAVVAVSLFSILIGASAILLIPTYVLLNGEAHVREARFMTLKNTLVSSDGGALAARLSTLSKNIERLKTFSSTSSASSVIREVLTIPRSGIVLFGFSYTPVIGSGGNVLTLSGTATTRDTLRAYQLALQNAPFARTAELPVSAYAKDTNIEFTITITLNP